MGQEAINVVDACQPDVVLMDINMPKNEWHRSQQPHQEIMGRYRDHWLMRRSG
jgi:CheY-like chemotaxis protein